MMAAAARLRKAASTWSSEKNPVVATTTTLSDLMATMTQAFNGGAENMGRLVTISRDIVSEGKLLVKHALACAATCPDRALKADLELLCERIPTLGVQLKIHASVNATSLSEGMDEHAVYGGSGQSLVLNAQNLIDAVMKTLKACHAASLKRNRFALATDPQGVVWAAGPGAAGESE
jgi:hypothetical protein